MLTDLLKAPGGVLEEPERKARSRICEQSLGLPLEGEKTIGALRSVVQKDDG